MERKLAELKAEEVADLKRLVTKFCFIQIHLSQLKIVHHILLVRDHEILKVTSFSNW